MSLTLPRGGGGFFWIFAGFFPLAFLGAPEPVTLSVGFNDVDPVGESVEERAGETFVAQYLGAVFKREVGGKDDALSFIRAAEDLKEQFSSGLGERDVPELVEDKQMASCQAFEDAFELPVVPCFEELGDQRGYGMEADVFSLGQATSECLSSEDRGTSVRTFTATYHQRLNP